MWITFDSMRCSNDNLETSMTQFKMLHHHSTVLVFVCFFRRKECAVVKCRSTHLSDGSMLIRLQSSNKRIWLRAGFHGSNVTAMSHAATTTNYNGNAYSRNRKIYELISCVLFIRLNRCDGIFVYQSQYFIRCIASWMTLAHNWPLKLFSVRNFNCNLGACKPLNTKEHYEWNLFQCGSWIIYGSSSPNNVLLE